MKAFINVFVILSLAYQVTGEKQTQLERLCTPERARMPLCRSVQVSPTERRIAPVSPDGDLYDNSLDMLALSEYIYELAELRKIARDTGDKALLQKLKVRKNKPKELSQLQRILKDRDNLETIKEQGGDARDAVNTLGLYLSDKDDKRIARKTKEDRKLYVFADDDESVKQSRVHGIAVNTRKKRVEVVFRGTANVSFKNAWYDWSTNFKALWKRTMENPAHEQKGITPNINLHRGFAKALLGKPVIEKKPIDAILEKDVKPLMKSGYRLYVSGHSLGGATATLFGYYAASDPCLTKSGPVTVYTYASPRVGGNSFRKAFKCLEERGKIRHGRFHNSNDKVPRLPYIGGTYKHVGMEINLRKELPPLVDYPTEHDWKQKGQGIIESIRSLPEVFKSHSCEEMMRRMKNAKQAFLKTSLEQEYRTMWGV